MDKTTPIIFAIFACVGIILFFVLQAEYSPFESQYPVKPTLTWYFFPGCSTIPEDYSLCLNTLECGYGTFARSVKGQGIVDRDEIWKWREGFVTINFTKCPPDLQEYYSSNSTLP